MNYDFIYSYTIVIYDFNPLNTDRIYCQHKFLNGSESEFSLEIQMGFVQILLSYNTVKFELIFFFPFAFVQYEWTLSLRTIWGNKNMKMWMMKKYWHPLIRKPHGKYKKCLWTVHTVRGLDRNWRALLQFLQYKNIYTNTEEKYVFSLLSRKKSVIQVSFSVH